MKPYTAAISLTSKCSVTPNPVAQCSVALRCALPNCRLHWILSDGHHIEILLTTAVATGPLNKQLLHTTSNLATFTAAAEAAFKTHVRPCNSNNRQLSYCFPQS